MSNKQLFAQIGVFALLGVNVAAYYFFWPDRAGQQTSSTTKSAHPAVVEVKEEKTPFPVKMENLAIPKPVDRLPDLAIPPKPQPIVTFSRQGDQVPGPLVFQEIPKLVIPPPPEPAELKLQPRKPPQSRDVQRTFDQVTDPIMAPEMRQPIPKKNYPHTPQVLPAITAAPLPTAIMLTGLMAKMPQSPWLLNVETVGEQTQLIARLKQPAQPMTEFKILCDRMEMKAPDGALQAVGKVTFIGSGLRGHCQRLTLPLNETRVIFEDHVEVVPEAGGGSEEKKGYVLRGEKISWELRGAGAAPAIFNSPAPPVTPTVGSPPSPPLFPGPAPGPAPAPFFPPPILEGPK